MKYPQALTKGWKLDTVIDNIGIYKMDKPFYTDDPNSPILKHIGFKFEDIYWTNYCHFDGDPDFFTHHLEMFKVRVQETKNWEKQTSKIRRK